MKPWKGHKAGADIIEELSREALKMGVKCLTFWGSSKDNLTKRPFEEKKELLKIYEDYFKKLINSADIFDNKTKIRIVGHWEEQFPKRLKKILKEGIEKTKHHTSSFLNFLLAYSGDDDIIQAVKEIKKEARTKARDFKVTNELFQKHLVSSDLPKVDLVIRTGVENDPHNSAGFLMWQTQNSQYYFSEKLFPDFNSKEFKKALEDFAGRERRMGK
jgi:undecaprenyl diphosphate synthase